MTTDNAFERIDSALIVILQIIDIPGSINRLPCAVKVQNALSIPPMMRLKLFCWLNKRPSRTSSPVTSTCLIMRLLRPDRTIYLPVIAFANSEQVLVSARERGDRGRFYCVLASAYFVIGSSTRGQVGGQTLRSKTHRRMGDYLERANSLTQPGAKTGGSQ